MKIRTIVIVLLMLSLGTDSRGLFGSGAAFDTATAGRSILPTELNTKILLNETPRHGEWHSVDVGSTKIEAYIVYPDRSDKAPILLISANNQKLTDRLRAVADQTAQEGFIAVVPDLLTGDSMVDAVRKYALRLPAANGRSAGLRFTLDTQGNGRMDVVVEGQNRQAAFVLSEKSWPEAITFLNTHTENYPNLIFLPSHAMMGHAAMEFTPQQRAPQQPSYPTGKPDNLPAGLMNAKSTIAKSPLRSQFVDIPVGNVKLRTRITYPQGSGTFPIVILMQHGPGADIWMQSVGDQLSREGFIALLPDILSGMGPNGGGTLAFQFEDEIIRANGQVGSEQAMRFYKAARDYGLKLPEANGKSASLGFCAGGGNSFRFAGEVPELSAAVVFYGGPPDDATMAKINAPVLAFAGTDDVRVAAGTEGAIEKMKKLGKKYETHIYQHATHSFLMYQNVGGNPEATADAWPRAIAFLKQNTR
jgi:carboxymethylenebutenolidase